MSRSRNSREYIILQAVTIDKLVHGGQGLGALPDGRKIFVWNALPGETVAARVLKARRDYAEGIAEEILKPSAERIEPRDEAYLSTSPWQIMTFDAENKYKQAILFAAFEREKVIIPEIKFIAGKDQWHYRNKMEYSFWADDEGLHLALFNRGSHGKRIVAGSSIARPEIDACASNICATLNKHAIRGSQLKTVVVRCDQSGNTVAALFVKDENFPHIGELNSVANGLTVCFSNPKSPASVLTHELYAFGDTTLTDKIMRVQLMYDVHSFFQVNVPVFEWVAQRIDYLTSNAIPKVDFYCGVGTIGIPTNATVLVDSDAHNIAMARINVGSLPIQVIESTAEKAISYIPSSGALIVDPPRAGLHPKVIEKIREAGPPLVAYLSCNPSTQARDIKILEDIYQLTCLEGYNFFPRTPHIESFALLTKR